MCSASEPNGPAMLGQPLRQADLIIPSEIFFGILREVHVIRGISIDEIRRRKRKGFKVFAADPPAGKDFPIQTKVGGVVEAGVVAERNVITAAPVETAQAVKAGAIEVVEKARGLGVGVVAVGDEFIKP